MHTNVGGADRTARLVAGAALAAGALFAPVDERLRALMGIGAAIALGTVLTGYCPANAMLGVDTSDNGWDGQYHQLEGHEHAAAAAGVVA